MVGRPSSGRGRTAGRTALFGGRWGRLCGSVVYGFAGGGSGWGEAPGEPCWEALVVPPWWVVKGVA